MKKSIFYLLIILASNTLCTFENKPKANSLYNKLINNIQDFNIIPLGIFMWPDYKNGVITRDEIIKEHYKSFIQGVDKKKYALIYNKINEEYLKKISSEEVHPVGLFPMSNNTSYWKNLAYTLSELYAQTELAENQSFDFLN